MAQVKFLPEVVDQFLQLADILYDEGYLGFKDAALDYSERLFREIAEQLPIKVRKGAPTFFKRQDVELFYSAFPRNKHTIWYVFYSVHEINGETVYLVRNLMNNHLLAQHIDDVTDFPIDEIQAL